MRQFMPIRLETVIFLQGTLLEPGGSFNVQDKLLSKFVHDLLLLATGEIKYKRIIFQVFDMLKVSVKILI